MINLFYPIKDTTIYESDFEKNTGVDSILELIHENNNSTIYNSRILLQFDLTEIQELISRYNIVNPRYELVLYTAKIEESPADVKIETKAVSGSWEMGTGNLESSPIVKNGTSWKWRNYENSIEWISGSLTPQEYSFYSVSGGGTWHSDIKYTATKSIANLKTDITLDVTSIIDDQLSGIIDNNGILLKYSDIIESSDYSYHAYKFFSNESNTIYSPKLRVIWNDSSYITGSLGLLDMTQEVVIYSRIKEVYFQNEKAKIRVFGRPKFIEKTYATQSQYLINYCLPSESYYEIRDTVTDDIIIPFDETGTKLSCDGQSNYFNLFMDNFQPERYYKILIKTKVSEFEEYILNDNLLFKVVR